MQINLFPGDSFGGRRREGGPWRKPNIGNKRQWSSFPTLLEELCVIMWSGITKSVAQYIFVDVFFFINSIPDWTVMFWHSCKQHTEEEYLKMQILEEFQMTLLNVCSHLDCASLAHWDALGAALRRETMVLWDGGRSEGRGRCFY